MFRQLAALGLFFVASIASSAQSHSPIQHVIFIVQENHSFCNYFGTFPGENCTQGQISTGAWVPLTHAPDQPFNCGHTWSALHTAMHNGKMDRFDKICPTYDGPPLQAYVQYYQSDIPNYWSYAQTYGLADRFFSSLAGPSFPNHLWIVAGQSGNIIDVPNGPVGATGFCDPATTATARALNTATNTKYYTSPCIEVTTIADLLDAKGVSWAYYADTSKKAINTLILNPFNAIRHIRNSADYQNVKPYTQFVTDAAAGTLPQVVWLTGTFKNTEHPNASVTAGMNWVTSQVNAVMSSPLWSSSVIFLTWDDDGGFYDSVPPPTLDPFGLGPRVPFLCIGPYCKPGYLSHAQMEFSSVNKCIENLFGLPSLSPRDVTVVDACTEMMDYSIIPHAPQLLGAKPMPAAPRLPINIDGANLPEDDDDD